MGSRGHTTSRQEVDRGTVTVPAAVVTLALLLLVVLGVQLGTAVVARHRAEVAADLGALAGAAMLWHGPDVGCRRAATVVERNGATLVSCRWAGRHLLIETVVPVAVWGTAGARARAGPVDGDGAG